MTPEDRAREIADAAIGEWDAEFLLHGKSAPSLVDLIAKHATAALSALATRVERETAERAAQTANEWDFGLSNQAGLVAAIRALSGGSST